MFQVFNFYTNTSVHYIWGYNWYCHLFALGSQKKRVMLTCPPPFLNEEGEVVSEGEEGGGGEKEGEGKGEGEEEGGEQEEGEGDRDGCREGEACWCRS